jgi:hypothetical protein
MIDWRKYDKALTELLRAKMHEAYRDTMREADIAWKSHLKAVKLIDLKNDGVKGETELLRFREALENWIVELELMANASKKITNWASKAVHTGGRDVEVEEDGEGNVDLGGGRYPVEYDDPIDEEGEG